MRSLRYLRCVGPVLLGLTLAQGCDHHCGPEGSWTELTTVRGSYDGYQVQAACLSEADVVSVLGRGPRWARDTPPDAAGRALAFGDFADLIGVSLVVRNRVFVDPKPRTGCTNSEAVLVNLNDWRDLDDAIASVGKLLRDGGLREEVLIQLAGLCPDDRW